ncbi:glutathione S-transferase family protein [bacterium (Candidatus Blackallbacteria) CG17_big_fil_post_rev_8_21_14_2_50_48_46]|uniref:Glutathione S-transferase family protein n=1 Tax=bacterium (Candidatus Blackallbacteria) CG17_big_fil_post_rev_8_21_14_2_50_48_46 TaxID=2014261 RepID=A0A2M7G5Z9_9BACT|nr:MAG: glutathione S-transferase [bacterium (Candidatus Blackallbacteria) CG18_big_fil_WC_8_21_14_2_50_49_26]PIW17477.1 MAG: glutathione S-transferase family protein [bacterium (Candidatus Blackallbacteria) CG17_big_fil_post_rev_8_21_14_2_50_48_46]PIW48331.1 MAG: glutathione S-transferase family protein [bacterium (Candidatus Blackallbacteria) CG13_big_fil_rev_8_21_14_2_50_49_14]
MSLQLYFNPQSRATVTKWVLDELQIEYELVPIDFKQGEHKRPEFLKVNPTGKLPALKDGEVCVYESVAIALYLADKFPEARLAPLPNTPERGRYLSLMVLATSQLEPSMGDYLLKQETPPSRGWIAYDAMRDVIEKEIGDGPYLFGDWFTVADILIGSMFIWEQVFQREPLRPALAAYVERLQSRPHGLKFEPSSAQ